MAVAALLLLLAGLLAMTLTGWPSYAVLLGVSCLIALAGLGAGSFDAALLQALPARVVGILEHDLLQGVALYALVGSLLRHTDVADRVGETVESLLARVGVRPRARAALGGYALGALTAPLNGSVGASVGMLAYTAARRWQRSGMPATRSVAFMAATAALGVVVPPSLVLMLLGDAMMRAHTEGLMLGGIAGVRVIGTADLIQACTPVALALAVGWGAVVALRAGAQRREDLAADASTETDIPPRVSLSGVLAPAAVLLMLVGVASGQLRAVEAAAAAALALFVHALAGGQLAHGRLRAVLEDAMALSGALFALLLAATTLGLMLRASGCDRLVADLLASLSGRPGLATAAVLVLLWLLAFVLDAFELVFLVIPLVMPPLLAMGVDAAWAACLALLVLQLGFLLPPWGYAVVLARAMSQQASVEGRALVREMAAFVVVLLVLIVVVFLRPEVTHWLRSAPERIPAATSGDGVDDLLRGMSSPRRGGETP